MKKKILFLVTEDWYFCSHRLPLAIAAKNNGYEVVVVTKINNHRQIIENEGIRVVNLDFLRKSKNPFKTLGTVRKIYEIYKKEKPDLVHHITLKCTVLGSLASLPLNISVVINALTGLGFIFTSNALLVRITKIALIEPVLKFLFTRKNVWIILQNIDDKRLLFSFDILNEDRTVLIRGSGVDLTQYQYVPEPEGNVKVIMACRMLVDKGVLEFVTAAKILIAKKYNASFILVGDTDEGNPSAISTEVLESWSEEGYVEWWGHRKDMHRVMQESHIICLPSHREGLSKVLLEAAAAGRPIVTSDVPGCREIVINDVNGLLVKVKNPEELSNALGVLIDDKSLREKYGANGRKITEADFSLEHINKQTLDLYELALESNTV